MPGMRNVTVRQLAIFTAATRAASFSEASRTLHLTQPAVSMQIRELEEAAGMPLFERGGRRLRLTQAGEEMARCAHDILRALDDADAAFSAIKGLRGGRLALAVVSTAQYFAPRLLAQFRARHPDVELRLQVDNRERVVRALVDDDLDIAIMGTPPAGVATVAMPFAKHPLVIIAPPTHPFARRRRILLRDLRDEPFLVREPGSGTRTSMERLFAEHDLQAKVAMEMSSNETIKQAVMAGLGVAFMSHHCIGLELAAHELVMLKVEGLPIIRQWNVVHRRDRRLSPAALAFKSFVLEEGSRFLRHWPQG